jgi:transposase
MKYITGTNRTQLFLFRETLDEIIKDDHIVKFIDTYINKMDMNKLEIKETKDGRGRPPYDPHLYLKIYIYCYLIKIRSSRKIERECQRNMELIWLTEQLAPDFWSIANFRKQNKKALINIFKEFLTFCHKLELLSLKLTAIDGTKMRGQNHNGNIYKRDDIDKLQKRIEEKIAEYLKELENNDRKEDKEYDFLNQNIGAKIKNLKKHQDKLGIIKDIFNNNPDLKRYFANDNDCRFQKDNGRAIVGYNGQIAVDEANKLIIANDVTNENNDLHQLNNMQDKIQEIKEELRIETDTLCTADAGYHSEAEIVESRRKKKFDTFIPHPNDVKTKERYGRNKKDRIPSKGFEYTNFKYDKEKDIFICPKGKELTKRGKGSIKSGVIKYRYVCRGCNTCDSKKLCTSSKSDRNLEISENYNKMQDYKAKVRSYIGKKIVRKRKELVEHPFGTLKRSFGFTYFMQKGLSNVKAEFSFMSFIYNLTRVLNIFSVKELINAI